MVRHAGVALAAGLVYLLLGCDANAQSPVHGSGTTGQAGSIFFDPRDANGVSATNLQNAMEQLSQTVPGGTGDAPASSTVGSLPTLTANDEGARRRVTDGTSEQDCTTGGGSTINVCLWNGSAWVDEDTPGNNTIGDAQIVQDSIDGSEIENGTIDFRTEWDPAVCQNGEVPEVVSNLWTCGTKSAGDSPGGSGTEVQIRLDGSTLQALPGSSGNTGTGLLTLNGIDINPEESAGGAISLKECEGGASCDTAGNGERWTLGLANNSNPLTNNQDNRLVCANDECVIPETALPAPVSFWFGGLDTNGVASNECARMDAADQTFTNTGCESLDQSYVLPAGIFQLAGAQCNTGPQAVAGWDSGDEVHLELIQYAPNEDPDTLGEVIARIEFVDATPGAGETVMTALITAPMTILAAGTDTSGDSGGLVSLRATVVQDTSSNARFSIKCMISGYVFPG